METRNIKITLDKAKEWYNSGNEQLKELALKAFHNDEIEPQPRFNDIKDFRTACSVLGIDYIDIEVAISIIRQFSKASAALSQLIIIRNALNFGQDLRFTKNPEGSHIYCPVNPITPDDSTYFKDELRSGKFEVIGKIKSEGEEYDVIGNCAIEDYFNGLCSIDHYRNVCNSEAIVGFLGCANEEIAKHFSKHFGMLLTEAKYGDLPDFEIIERKLFK